MRLLAAVAFVAIAAGAQTPDVEFFEKRVRPLFASKCYGCHGEKVQMGGLVLPLPRVSPTLSNRE